MRPIRKGEVPVALASLIVPIALVGAAAIGTRPPGGAPASALDPVCPHCAAAMSGAADDAASAPVTPVVPVRHR